MQFKFYKNNFLTKAPWSWGLVDAYYHGGQGFKPPLDHSSFVKKQILNSYRKRAGGHESSILRRWRRRAFEHGFEETQTYWRQWL